MVVSRQKLSTGRRVGHIQLCLSEEGATRNRLPQWAVTGLLLFILTLGVGRVSVEEEWVLGGVENFFSDFTCLSG